MIKFRGERNGRRVFGLCLSEEDVRTLKADQPVLVNLADLGGPDVEVTILYGKSDREVFDRMKAAGHLPDHLGFPEPRPGQVAVVRVTD